MADANYAAVAGALEQRFRKTMAKQPNRATVTLNLLRKRPGAGKNAAWDIQVGTATGSYYDDGADVAAFNADVELPATLNWAELGDATAITGRAEDAAAGSNVDQMNEYVMGKLRECGERAAAKANVELWSGDGTAAPQKLLGLAAAAGPLDSSGTYAGVNRGTYPQWASNKLTNGGVVRAVSVGLVETAITDTYVASGREVKACVTTPKIFQRLAETLDPQRRYMQTVTIRGQEIVLQEGWKAISINGIPIFMDKDVPAGHFGGLDLDAIDVEFLPVAPTRIARGEVKGFIPIAGTPQEQGTQVPDGGQALMAAVYALARTGNKTKFQVLTTLQLTATRCNSSFLITDLGV